MRYLARICQTLTTKRYIDVPVEASSMDEARDIAEAADAPPDNAGWVTTTKLDSDEVVFVAEDE